MPKRYLIVSHIVEVLRLAKGYCAIDKNAAIESTRRFMKKLQTIRNNVILISLPRKNIIDVPLRRLYVFAL